MCFSFHKKQTNKSSNLVKTEYWSLTFSPTMFTFFSFKNSVLHKRSLNYDTSSNKMNCELMLTYDTPALRQTGSRNLTGQKTLPTIWGTYMTLVTKYQISAINSYWEKCHEKYLGRNEGQTEVKQYTPSPFGEWGYNNLKYNLCNWNHLLKKKISIR